MRESLDVYKRQIYNSKLVTRLVNSIMLDGKKGVAQKIVYEAFETVKAVSYTHLRFEKAGR